MAILSLHGETDPLAYSAASAGGDEFDNREGFTELDIYNQAGIALRVEFTEQRDCTFGEKGAHAAQIETVAPGASTRVRKFQIWRYNNANHRVEMTYPDGVAGLVVAALYRPPI